MSLIANLIKKTSSLVALSVICSLAYAEWQPRPISDEPDQNPIRIDEAQPPEMDRYQYINTSKPKKRGTYVSAKYYRSIIFGNLSNASDPINPMITTSDIAKDKITTNANSFALGLGYAWDPVEFPVRVEAEFTYRTKTAYNADPLFVVAGATKTILNSDIASHSLFFVGYYDLFNKDRNWNPYINLGVGTALHTTSSSSSLSGGGYSNSLNKNKTALGIAWQVGLGSRYQLAANSFLDLGYRYMQMGKMKWQVVGLENNTVRNINVESDVSGHEVALAVNLRF